MSMMPCGRTTLLEYNYRLWDACWCLCCNKPTLQGDLTCILQEGSSVESATKPVATCKTYEALNGLLDRKGYEWSADEGG
jgi:hypothetical protein